MNLLRSLYSKMFTCLLAAVLLFSGLAAPVSALRGSSFKSDRIADDSIFFDGNSMSTSDIQNFLNSKVPTCDTWHSGSGSNQPPFTCLKSYSQNIGGRPADAYCSGAVGGGTKS